MKTLLMILGLAVAVFAVGCKTKASLADLKQARALRITYNIQTAAPKEVLIDDKDEVKKIMEKFRIRETREGAFAGLGPSCSVDFLLRDESEWHAIFVGPEQIEPKGFGQVYLDRAFYDCLSEIVSKRVGTPIELLKTN